MAARTKKQSFWDTPEAKAATSGGGKYLSASEKDALIDGAVVLEIVGVKFDEKNQFQGNPAPRYVVTFDVPEGLKNVTGGERFSGFAISKEDQPSSRDNLLEALTDYIGTAGATPVLVRMEMIGQFVALVKAEA
jgi:hypothetical protein